MVKTWRWRLLLVASVALIVAGIALLTSSLLAPPVVPAGLDAAADWHVASHEPGARFVPGLAVHPGPGAAALAAELTPVTGPTSILAVNVPRVALPTSPGAVAQDQ